MECDYYDGAPIAWRDDKHRFEPFVCVDTNGLIVFYDGYACPEYRCHVYSPRLIIMPPLSEVFRGDLDFREAAKKLVDKLRAHGVDVADYRVVYWCYTGDKRCEEEALETWQERLRELAHYLNKGYEIVELQEQDEGDSILLVVKPDDIPRLEKLTAKHYAS